MATSEFAGGVSGSTNLRIVTIKIMSMKILVVTFYNQSFSAGTLFQTLDSAYRPSAEVTVGDIVTINGSSCLYVSFTIATNGQFKAATAASNAFGTVVLAYV